MKASNKLLNELDKILNQTGDYQSEGLFVKISKVVNGGRWIGNVDDDLRKLARAKRILKELGGDTE